MVRSSKKNRAHTLVILIADFFENLSTCVSFTVFEWNKKCRPVLNEKRQTFSDEDRRSVKNIFNFFLLTIGVTQLKPSSKSGKLAEKHRKE